MATPCLDKARSALQALSLEPGANRCLEDFLTEYEELARASKASSQQIEALHTKTQRNLKRALELNWFWTREMVESTELDDIASFVDWFNETRGPFLKRIDQLRQQSADAKSRLEKLLTVEAFVQAVHEGGGPLLSQGCGTAASTADEIVQSVLDCLAK